MESVDPAKKQYFIFSLVIAFIISIFYNFVLINITEGSAIYGFPMSLVDLEGANLVLARTVNTVIIGTLLSIPVYMGLMWLQTRGGGGGDTEY